jgi:hypothetical protein
MPIVRKLTPEEVQSLEVPAKGPRKLVEEQYDQFLAEYDVGDYGEAELDEEENRLTVRNRLKAAATRHGLGIQFKRTGGDIVRFQIVAGNGHVDEQPEAEEPEPEPAFVASATPPATKGRGGRPKKQTA